MLSSNTTNSTHLFVRSNIHMANLDMALKKHLHLQKFVDVTISCEGRTFKCHRLILAAASPLFEDLFIDNPAQHPIVLMPLGIKAWTIQALIDFMYKGHVNVSQCGLKELVRSAELLKISGLDNARKDLAPYGYKDNNNCKLRRRKRTTDYHLHEDNDFVTDEDEFAGDDLDDFGSYQQENAEDDDMNASDDVGDFRDPETLTAAVQVSNDAENDVNCQPVSATEEEDENSFQIKSMECANKKEMLPIERNDQLLESESSNAAVANILLEEHNDSGLPDSPPNTASVGKIRVKSRIKLFDKTVTPTKRHPELPHETDEINRSLRRDNSLEPLMQVDEQQVINFEKHRYKDMQKLQLLSQFHVKAEQIDFEAENIVCQPNVSYICGAVGTGSTIRPQPQSHSANVNSNVHNELLKAMLTQGSSEVYLDHLGGSYANGAAMIDLEPDALKRCSKYSKHCYNKFPARKTTASSTTATLTRLSNGTYSDNGQEPSLQTVTLRSPRSNQPRSYSNEALYNALMAVKHGESIYRASREYRVPRKTLRNWMKRWDIKSQYPMPKQLKEAASKKKIIENLQ